MKTNKKLIFFSFEKNIVTLGMEHKCGIGYDYNFIVKSKYSDITITSTDNVELHFFRVILAEYPVFDGMLNGPFLEKATSKIHLDIDNQTINVLLNILYGKFRGYYSFSTIPYYIFENADEIELYIAIKKYVYNDEILVELSKQLKKQLYSGALLNFYKYPEKPEWLTLQFLAKLYLKSIRLNDKIEYDCQDFTFVLWVEILHECQSLSQMISECFLKKYMDIETLQRLLSYIEGDLNSLKLLKTFYNCYDDALILLADVFDTEKGQLILRMLCEVSRKHNLFISFRQEIREISSDERK